MHSLGLALPGWLLCNKSTIRLSFRPYQGMRLPCTPWEIPIHFLKHHLRAPDLRSKVKSLLWVLGLSETLWALWYSFWYRPFTIWILILYNLLPSSPCAISHLKEIFFCTEKNIQQGLCLIRNMGLVEGRLPTSADDLPSHPPPPQFLFFYGWRSDML